jgi:hypothetical protein
MSDTVSIAEIQRARFGLTLYGADDKEYIATPLWPTMNVAGQLQTPSVDPYARERRVEERVVIADPPPKTAVKQAVVAAPTPRKSAITALLEEKKRKLLQDK